MRAIAFDCFNTLFNISTLPRGYIEAYAKHVQRTNFNPYIFPDSWYKLKAHPDVATGIQQLQDAGFLCVAFSNGERDLIHTLAAANHFHFDHIVNLVAHQVYKPNLDAYSTIEKDLNIPASETLLVTANPTFGDLEGAKAVGMHSQLIRQPGTPQTVAELLTLPILNPSPE